MKDEKLDNFKELKIELDYKDILKKYSNECKQNLKRISPSDNKRTKSYADGWEVVIERNNKDDYSATVWNATDWQLTHLLENGHIIANKRNGVGWASAKPHINKAYLAVKQPFIRDMKTVRVKFK